MNPGPVEEGGKVATAFIDSMKANPLALAVLVFNLVVVALIWVSGREFRANADRVTTALLAQHSDMVQMISRCIVPAPPTP